jgi:hypothetical protein
MPDGTRALAWADNTQDPASRASAGRVHLTLEGAANASIAPPPGLETLAPRDTSLRPDQPLRLPIRCSAACDVRASLGLQRLDGGATLAAAGSGELRLEPGPGPIAPGHGTLKVHLTWSSPGSSSVSTRTVALRLRRLPSLPLPRISGLRARRGSDGTIDVRWTGKPASRTAFFLVYGTRAKSRAGAPIGGASVEAKGRRRFHLRLSKAARARYVHVFAYQPGDGHDDHAVVRVQ